MKLFFALFLSMFQILGAVRAQDILTVPLPEHSRNDAPVIAFGPEGSLWLAWSSFHQGRFRLAVCSRKGGDWTVVEYPDEFLTDQIEPQMIVDTGGRPRLVYVSYDGRQWVIKQTLKTK